MSAINMNPLPLHANIVAALAMTLDDLPALESLDIPARKRQTSLRLACQISAAYSADSHDEALVRLNMLIAALTDHQDAPPLAKARDAAQAYLVATKSA